MYRRSKEVLKDTSIQLSTKQAKNELSGAINEENLYHNVDRAKKLACKQRMFIFSRKFIIVQDMDYDNFE